MHTRLLCLALVGAVLIGHPSEAKRVMKAVAHKVQAMYQPPVVQNIEDQRKKWNDLMWNMADMAINKGLGYLPGPSGVVQGHVSATGASVVVNLHIAAWRTGLTLDRELGHDEAWGTMFAALNPFPFPIGLYEIGASFWKGKDLCKEEGYRDYPGLNNYEQPEHDLVPKVARASWYGQRWCGHARDDKYDALLKDVGMTKRIFANTPKRVRKVVLRRKRVKTIASIDIFSSLAKPTKGVSWEPRPVSASIDLCKFPFFDGNGKKIVEEGCS